MAKLDKKLETFVWQGTDRKGDRLNGEINALTTNLAKAELRRQGVNPIKVKKKPRPLFGLGGQRRQRVSTRDIAVFSRQVATMISAGVPLVQAFEIIAKGHENKTMQTMLHKIKTDIESGNSLSQAMAKHPRHFDKLFCALIEAGETAGILETLLDEIASYKEKTEAIKGKIRKALFYPVTIISIGVVVTFALMIWVVPQFQRLFVTMGGELPLATQMVVNMSEFVQQWWYIIVGGAGLAGYAAFQARQTSEPFNEFIDRTLLQLPVFGELIRKATIARFSRTLATMFAAGVPLVEGMESVASASGNRVFEKAILQIRDDIATGQQLQMAMQHSGLFPNMVVQMVAIGEESGSLDKMLAKVADFYEREVDDVVDGLSSLIEPVIMVVLGTLIGGLVIAMYLPVFKMGQMV